MSEFETAQQAVTAAEAKVKGTIVSILILDNSAGRAQHKIRRKKLWFFKIWTNDFPLIAQLVEIMIIVLLITSFFPKAEMEALQIKLDAEKQEHIAKLFKLAQVKGEKLDPESLPYQEVRM